MHKYSWVDIICSATAATVAAAAGAARNNKNYDDIEWNHVVAISYYPNNRQNVSKVKSGSHAVNQEHLEEKKTGWRDRYVLEVLLSNTRSGELQVRYVGSSWGRGNMYNMDLIIYVCGFLCPWFIWNRHKDESVWQQIKSHCHAQLHKGLTD